MSRSGKKDDSFVNNSQNLVNDLNNFYCRFDTMYDRAECDEICKNLPEEISIFINEDDVAVFLN